MKVKEFIKTILKDVTEAVVESNNDKHKFYMKASGSEGIDFDLAVVFGEAGVQMSTGADVEAQKSLSKEIVNRIKFKVYTYEK